MNYNNIANASTGYTREERVIGYHQEYKARLIADHTFDDFASVISNLKGEIQKIEQTKEQLKKHLMKMDVVEENHCHQN